jgi:cytochrome c oxidase subunit 2
VPATNEEAVRLRTAVPCVRVCLARVRRGSIIQLTAIGLVAGAICTAVALLIPWLPTAAGKEADRIHYVYWFTTTIAIAVFAVVTAVLLYSIWKFRAGPDDDSDGPPIHGHTTLEIVWTAIPAVLVTAISIVSAVVLAENGHAGADPLQIHVKAQQFAWQFTYPNGKTFGFLTLPKDRSVKLELTSADVIHSFWVPQLSQKQDAVPGIQTSIVITPTKVGTYPIICTELCGLGHAIMRSHVDIVTPARYDAWVKSGGANTSPAGLTVFQANGCGSCHTFKPAGSNGKVGPDLDNLLAEAQKANKGPLAQFVHQSIVDPGAYLEPGYSDAMPHIFGQTLTEKQLNDLVQYLVQGANANK